jgi:hypothetical protein
MSNDSIKWQWEVVEQLLKWRNRCFEMAERAPTEVMGAKLLSMGHRYEIGARLIDRARECILGSEELIIGAEALLSPRSSRDDAYDPKVPGLRPTDTTVAPVPSTSSEVSHR